MSGAGTTRREFFFQLGGTAIGIALLPLASCDNHTVAPIVTGSSIPFLTAQDAMYLKNGAEVSISNWQMPNIDPQAWSMKIDGLVSSPLTLKLSDLEAESMSAIELLKTMRCIIDDNDVAGLIGTAVWRGVPLRIFLDRARIDRTRTKRLRLYGQDGFTNNLTLDRVYSDFTGTEMVEPLLVTHMNGDPLIAEHGKPVRLIVHDGFGYMNVKWLTRVEATDDDSVFGTYQDVGFIDGGVMRVVSRITRPLTGVQVPRGTVRILGFGLSGSAGIDHIEISIDNGAWQSVPLVPIAQLAAANPAVGTAIQSTSPDVYPYPYRGVWAPWSFDWQATAGSHSIRVRATDRAGNTQPDMDDDITDGINAAPTIQVNVI
jgi:DMSO/TMAO reductase YedYZ molybdopterin-dependent catalytic subunit